MKKGYRKSEKMAMLLPEQLNEVLAEAENEYPLEALDVEREATGTTLVNIYAGVRRRTGGDQA